MCDILKYKLELGVKFAENNGLISSIHDRIGHQENINFQDHRKQDFRDVVYTEGVNTIFLDFT